MSILWTALQMLLWVYKDPILLKKKKKKKNYKTVTAEH